MAHSDTSKEAHQVLISIYKQMTPAVKMHRIFEAYRTGKILAMAGLKFSYPKNKSGSYGQENISAMNF